MNIVFLGTAFPYRGGLATFNERLTLELQKADHSIQIYNFKLQYPDFLFPGATQYSQSESPKNIHILDKVNSISPFNWWKIGKELEKMSPDLILVKYWLPFMAPCFGTILRLAKQNQKTKVICIIDNIIPHEPRFFDKWFTKYFVGPVDGFIGMSEKTLLDLDEFDKKSPRKLSPHPIFDNFGDKIDKTIAKRNLGLAPDIHYFLFFGFIRDYKGLDWLLEAYAAAKNKLKNTKLLIAGEFYSDSESYLALIQKYQLENLVELHTHFIENEKVCNYFSCADLLVLPYKSATQSGVTQIGFHFEIPMLVTNVGGLPEMIIDNQNGILVEPNPKSIAEGLIRFATLDNYHTMIENIKSDKKKYSWEKMKDSIFDVYHQIINL